MASDFIDINGNASRTAGKFRYFIDSYTNVQDYYNNLAEVLSHIASGSDWSSLAAELGITQAQAEQIYAVWVSAGSEVNGTFINQLISRCG